MLLNKRMHAYVYNMKKSRLMNTDFLQKSQQERLMMFLEHEGTTKKRFEAQVGLPNGSISKWRNGYVPPRALTKISAYYPDLNVDWLLTGKGSMLNSDSDYDYEEKTPAYNSRNDRPNKQASLPLLPMDCIAGYSGWDNAGVRLSDCPQYIVPEFINAQAEFLIRVSGSSMYPKYSSGDILACRKVQQITFIQWGKVYVIDSQQGVMVKRLFEDPSDHNCIICKSDNDNYPPFSLPKEEIRSLSIVVGVIRME